MRKSTIIGLLLCTLFLSGWVTTSGDKIFNGIVKVTGDFINPSNAQLGFSVGTESVNAISVVVTVMDAAGNVIPKDHVVDLWLASSATGGEAAVAPDGNMTHSDGSLMQTITAAKHKAYATGADGDVTIVVTDDDADNDWYLRGEVQGQVWTSAIINHATD